MANHQLQIRAQSRYTRNLISASPQYSIIVPAYNERERVALTLQRIVEYVRGEGWNAEIIAVDDGSRDETPEIISRLATQYPELRLIQNPGNQGKGYAVRNGMRNARGEMLLFTDADLSSPISEARKLFAAIENGANVAIGSRWLDPSLQFQPQPLSRRIFSRTFNLFLRIMLGLNFHDTQCGFKAFTRNAAEAIFPLQQINRWGFDAEILYIARRKKLKIAEVPVAWGHDDRSTIHPLRDGIRMGTEVLKVKWSGLRGKYR